MAVPAKAGTRAQAARGGPWTPAFAGVTTENALADWNPLDGTDLLGGRMHRMASHGSPPTLPDLLCNGLDVVFIGINPSLFSAAEGHYFARRANRFWPAFSRSTLSRAAREAMGLQHLEPVHDSTLLAHGFGFTDLVKRPSKGVRDLAASELAAGVASLAAKIERYGPKVACVHGIMAYRPIHRALMPGDKSRPGLGLQAARIARTPLFVVPNPSPANAHFTPAEQTRWYDELARYLALADR